MLSLKFNKENGLNILCLGAHCDDIEIGAGGTILKLCGNYKVNSVKWLVFASNDVRKKEAEQSAHLFLENVAAREIEVKTCRDGFLPYMATEIKEIFEDLKRSFVPDLIFTHYRNDRHQDHRLVSDLTWNTWRNHLILEYEIPKYDGDIGIPNLYIPIEEEILKKKNQIMLTVFESQMGKHWFDEETFTSLPRLRGMESASKYAEAFYARKILI